MVGACGAAPESESMEDAVGNGASELRPAGCYSPSTGCECPEPDEPPPPPPPRCTNDCPSDPGGGDTGGGDTVAISATTRPWGDYCAIPHGPVAESAMQNLVAQCSGVTPPSTGVDLRTLRREIPPR